MSGELAEAEQQWIDPVEGYHPLTSFRLYRQPSRPELDAQGSYQLYLPEAYGSLPEARFPVLYWLHGGFGNSRQGWPVVERVHGLIEAGVVPPVIIVMPQALPIGWYIDSKDGSRPIEQVMVHDLIGHVDASYRTMGSAEGRWLEGFSMGGYGALRLGLKYPRLFSRISAMGPAILEDMALEPEERTANTFFGDHDYYRAVSPWTLALANAPEVRKNCVVRLMCGMRDTRLATVVLEFDELLHELGIPHQLHEVAAAGHEIDALIDNLGDRYFDFWAFPVPPRAERRTQLTRGG